MTFAFWALFLLLQNAAATFISRARNSGSYLLHLVAAICSNGVWFAAQFVSLTVILELIRHGTWPQTIATGLFYTTFTVAGSVGMHWVSVRFIERRVK